MRRILIVGVDSPVGSDLKCFFIGRGWEVQGTTRRQELRGDMSTHYLDLASTDIGGWRLPQVDVAVFVAAISRFVDCNAAPDMAHRVNVTSPSILSARFAAQGTRSILLSTSAVFDGLQPFANLDTLPHPRSLYGRFKLEAEKSFLAIGGNVVRLTKVLSKHSTLFAKWRSSLSHGTPLHAVSDMTLAPIGLSDVQVGMMAALQNCHPLVHVSGRRDITYLEAAMHLAAGFGRRDLVRAADAKSLGISKEEHSRYSTLDTSLLSKTVSWEAPDPGTLINQVFL